MIHTPYITINMPILNRKQYVIEAIESIQKQVFQDWELDISDGGSTDGTLEVLEEYSKRDPRIRIFSNCCTTIAGARNSLLNPARGEFLAILDSDDIAYPERLTKQSDFLRNNPDVAGVGGAFDFIDADGNPATVSKYKQRLTDPGEIRLRQRAGWNCFVHSTMMFRRSVLLKLGGYREIFALAEDDDVFLRFLDRHDLANLSDKVGAYRWHGSNTTGSLSSQIHRVVATASAHCRMAGLPDYVNERRDPIDYPFLLELLSLLGNSSLPVWLMWIGLLQFYRHGEKHMLPDAWRKALVLLFQSAQKGEVLRHWETYRNAFPKEHVATLSSVPTWPLTPECVWRRMETNLS